MHPEIDPPEAPPGAPEWVVAAVGLGVFAGLAVVAAALPEEAMGLAERVGAHLAETGLGNPVNAVLLDFRAFDTLLEKAVLVLALVGVWGLVPAAGLTRPAGNLRTHLPAEPQLTLLLKVLVPLALLAAVYLFWVGADEPGGAFQSGTILAAVGVLLVLGRALPPPSQASPVLRWFVVAGFLVFVGAGIVTAMFGTGFLDYPEGWAKTIILTIEVGLALSVGATLFLQSNGLPEGREGRVLP